MLIIRRSLLVVVKQYPNAQWHHFHTYEEAFDYVAEGTTRRPSSTKSSDVPSDRGRSDEHSDITHSEERLQRTPTNRKTRQGTPTPRLAERNSAGAQARALSFLGRGSIVRRGKHKQPCIWKLNMLGRGLSLPAHPNDLPTEGINRTILDQLGLAHLVFPQLQSQ
jgi:hypothetical protein